MLLKGKKGIITGIAGELSIAHEVAKVAVEQGAEICITYQKESFEKRVRPLAERMNCDFLAECDATNQASVDSFFDMVSRKWGKIDFILHSMAYIDKQELNRKFLNCDINNFLYGMHASCFSLVSLSNKAQNLMTEGGSILTLSYYGAEKVMPNYNAMGVIKAALEASVRYLASDLGEKNIRVNAISAGPIKTLAASAISGFNNIIDIYARNAPLRRNINANDVAKSAIYFFSELSSGVTGEIHYVDSGYNIMGLSS